MAMRFAYAILAHDAFGQLEGLVTRLLAGNEDLAVVHVDRRSRLPANFLSALPAELRARVQLIRPGACALGSPFAVSSDARTAGRGAPAPD
jgi:hypothetical protein